MLLLVGRTFMPLFLSFRSHDESVALSYIRTLGLIVFQASGGSGM